MLKPTPVLTALSLLTATLLASCGTPAAPQPEPAARLPLTSVHLTVAPVPGWTPADETVSLIALGNTAGHLVAQTALVAGQVTVALPGEAALSAALFTVDTTTPPTQGCTLTQPGSGTGYSVPSFKTASVYFTATTTSSPTGERFLQDADPNGPASSLLYVDRDVRVQSTASCVANGRTDVTTLNLDLVKGWNLALRTDTGTGPYTHVFRAAPATSSSASLNLIGGLQASAPTP